MKVVMKGFYVVGTRRLKASISTMAMTETDAIFGKLKSLSARGYTSHTLVLENLPTAKCSRYPRSTQLGSSEVWVCLGHEYLPLIVFLKCFS